MRIRNLQRLLLLSAVLTMVWTGCGFCQTVTVFKSPNATTDPGVTVEEMVTLDYRSTLGLGEALIGYGSVATVNTDGEVKIEVYAYDASRPEGKRALIYRVINSRGGSQYAGDGVLYQVTSPGRLGPVLVHSDDVEEMAANVKIYMPVACADYADITYMQSIGTLNRQIAESCKKYVTPNQPVIVEVTATNATFTKVKIPGIGEMTREQIVSPKVPAMEKFLNPNAYPNFIMLAAHRGYWKDDTPENSMEAVRHALAMGVEMVEIDVRKTKDNQLVLAHDYHLGRLTDIPAHIYGKSKFQSAQGDYVLSKMTLRDLRPDLYGDQSKIPVHLKDGKGNVREVIPTLEEVFRECRYKIIVDIDKIEGFYRGIYVLAASMNMLNQVVVKGRFDSPQKLKEAVALDSSAAKQPAIDWKRFMFTPVYFPEFEVNFQTSIASFVTDAGFNCPGVELIYMNEDDALIPFISYLKGKNKQVIQFPQYPENSAGVYNPKKRQYSDIDPRVDHRNDWEWLLEAERRPSLIITDRLEVLLDLLKLKKLRE